MAKKGSDRKKQKPRKDSGKPGSKAKKINDKARKSKKQTQTVYLPAVIVKPPEAEPMSEHEISYADALLAVEMEKLAAKGLTNDQIIKEIGISRDTFYRKLKNEPYFSYALFKHRGIAAHNVENSLYKRAVGYSILEKTTEAKPIKYKDKDGIERVSYELMVAKVVEKTVEPDVAAQKFWLSNRKSDEWKMRVEPAQAVGSDMSQMSFTIKRRGD